MGESVRVITGDCREIMRTLDAGSVQTCVTSPPYFGLRDYGVDGQIGQEPTPDEFVDAMVEVFREVRRVLRDDGTLWLNLGDSYAQHCGGGAQGATSQRIGRANVAAQQRRGSSKLPSGFKPKDLIGIPWRVAFALQADGWWLRSAIVWHKPNPMPESVTDRPTSSYEMVFLLAKSERYFYDAAAVAEVASVIGGRACGQKNDASRKDNFRVGTVCGNGKTRNLRNVWTIATQPNPEAHFATYPPALVEPCIKAGSRPGDLVLDPFGGSGTTGIVAQRLGRRAILCELNPEYAALASARVREDVSGPVTRAESRAKRRTPPPAPLFDIAGADNA